MCKSFKTLDYFQIDEMMRDPCYLLGKYQEKEEDGIRRKNEGS